MISISDTIKFSRVYLGNDELYSLTQLYLPEIGIDSYSLYMFLNYQLTSNEINVRVILDYTGLENLGQLEYALNKLEGIGLVKKYYHKTKGYLYDFKPPLSSEDFFHSSLLAHMYMVKVGEVEYTTQKNRLKKDIGKGYIEETKAFDEVYKAQGFVSSNETININVPTKIKNDIRVRNDKFDYVLFKMFIGDDILSADILDDKDFENQILKISYQYKLTEEEMKNVVVRSVTRTNDLNFEDIDKTAGFIFQNKAADTSLTFPEKKVEVADNNLTTDEKEIVRISETNSITDMLAIVSGGKGSLADVRDYTKLLEVTNLPVEVINVLIFHLAGFKGEENVSYTYIEKVARNWMKTGCKTAKEAILLTREKEVLPKKGKKIVEQPEWMKKEKTIPEIKEEDTTTDKDLMKKVFG